jgi:hypothetical protein
MTSNLSELLDRITTLYDKGRHEAVKKLQENENQDRICDWRREMTPEWWKMVRANMTPTLRKHVDARLADVKLSYDEVYPIRCLEDPDHTYVLNVCLETGQIRQLDVINLSPDERRSWCERNLEPNYHFSLSDEFVTEVIVMMVRYPTYIPTHPALKKKD